MIKTILIKDVINAEGESLNVETSIKTMLSTFMPLSSTILDNLTRYVYIQLHSYGYVLDYHFLPIYIEDEQNIYSKVLDSVCLRFAQEITKYSTLLINMSNDFSQLTGLKNTKYSSTTFANESTSGGTYAMNENAPIDADIETINTPHMKSQAKSSGEKEFLNPEIKEENNPYYYEKFLQIIEKYNAFELINSCIKKMILEYNTLI